MMHCDHCGDDHDPIEGLPLELGIVEDELVLFIGPFPFPIAVDQARDLARGFTEGADWVEWRRELRP